MTIKAYCMGWHIGESSAFHDILVTPMSQNADIKLTAWDGVSTECFAREPSRSELPLIFCMRPPPESLLADSSRRVVWIPMLDNIAIKGYSENWWRKLPKTLRIVAFSKEVARMSRAVGLPTISLKYYPDPSEFKPAVWTDGNVMFYWNRRGLMSADFIKRLCLELAVDRLLFRPDLDAGIPRRKHYELPSRIGSTAVENLEGIDSKESYHEAIESANIFLAPRGCEGVGLTVVEALVRGCSVFSYDGAAMNEYICHKENGYLFAKANGMESLLSDFENFFTKWSPFNKRLHGYVFNQRQNWGEIRALDLKTIGERARLAARDGYGTWASAEHRYADFLLKW